MLRFLLSLVTAAGLVLGAQAAAANAPEDVKASPDASLEADLAKVFADIEKDRLDQALSRVNALLKTYPNFRLGNLIKGDLLLARSQPISTFGNVQGPKDELAGLRAEAIARLRAYKDRPPTGFIPSSLVQMAPEQKYAVVVDTRHARLYVFANDKGRPRFVTDYYVSHGKAGADKQREGDNRTPVGVYHVTSWLAPSKLADLYGDGAFPINYPNEWDRMEGRTGHGIWLHGTPSNTYSRPPLASEGCVVLSNPDLTRLASYVQVGLTPVIISDQIEWLKPEAWAARKEDLDKTIETWRKDWESLDPTRYLAHYARNFRSGKMDYARWSSVKRKVAANRHWVKVGIRNLSMFRSPGQAPLVVVTFDQDYRSDGLNDRMRKRQYWIREDGEWKIAYEGPA